jgi:hypothetical protein
VTDDVKGSIKVLVSNRTHLINLIIFVVLWIIATFNYYLVYFQIKYMKGDFFLNTLVSSLTEMTAYVVSGFILNSLGIKLSYLISFAITIFGATLYLTLHTSYE